MSTEELLTGNLFTTEEDANQFIRDNRSRSYKFSLNLLDDNGEDILYPSGSEITDLGFDKTYEFMKNWIEALPSLEEMIDCIFQGLKTQETFAENNLIDFVCGTGDSGDFDDGEENVDDNELINNLAEMYGIVDKELSDVSDDLLDALEDFESYISNVFLQSRLLNEDMTQYLKCTRASISNDKLYVTVQLYVDILFELRHDDKNQYIEVANEINHFFIRIEENLLSKVDNIRDRLIGN